MNILIENLGWMSWNIFLAFVGMALGLLLIKTKKRILKIVLFILWVLFVPNTIYLITDLQYLPEQFLEVELPLTAVLLIQYMVIFFLGIITYMIGIDPLEKIIKNIKVKGKGIIYGTFFLTNYLIAFGVFLGKIERINSWDVFTKPFDVVQSSLFLLSSSEIMIFIFIFGSVINILYFSLSKTLLKLTR